MHQLSLSDHLSSDILLVVGKVLSLMSSLSSGLKHVGVSGKSLEFSLEPVGAVERLAQFLCFSIYRQASLLIKEEYKEPMKNRRNLGFSNLGISLSLI